MSGKKIVIKSSQLGSINLKSIKISKGITIKNPTNSQVYGTQYNLTRKVDGKMKNIIIETIDDAKGTFTYFGAQKKATTAGAKLAKDLQLSIRLNDADEGEDDSKEKFRKNLGKIVAKVEDLLIKNKELKIPSNSKKFLKNKGISCPLSFFNKKEKEEQGTDYEKNNKSWREGKIPSGTVLSGFLKLKSYKKYKNGAPLEWENKDISTRVYIDKIADKNVLELFGKYFTGKFKLHLTSVFINNKKEVFLQIKVHSARISIDEGDETEESEDEDYDNGRLSDEDEDDEDEDEDEGEESE